MKQEQAIALLEQQRSQIDHLKKLRRFSAPFETWKRDTEVVIGNIFPSKDYAFEFRNIRYRLSMATGETAAQDRYVRGLDSAAATLTSLINEINQFGLQETAPQPAPKDAVETLERICKRFHDICRRLRQRHDSRPTLDVRDEYDVQDLLHALLTEHFDDIRAEDPVPSRAGAGSRTDFVLKEHQTVIEVKKTRQSLDGKKLGEELIVDIERYRSHPNCSTLVCFVYDPDGYIQNARGIESDLSGVRDGLNVKVIIAP